MFSIQKVLHQRYYKINLILLYQQYMTLIYWLIVFDIIKDTLIKTILNRSFHFFFTDCRRLRLRAGFRNCRSSSPSLPGTICLPCTIILPSSIGLPSTISLPSTCLQACLILSTQGIRPRTRIRTSPIQLRLQRAR